MTRTWRTALCLAAVLALTAGAKVLAETASGEGVGTYTCAEFARVGRADKSLAPLYFSWAQGWMTGWNLAQMDAAKPTRDLKGLAVADQQAFIRAYCGQHPSALYMEAVYRLYFSLKPAVK